MIDFFDRKTKLFLPSITRDQAKDSGMALVLIYLIVWVYWKHEIAIIAAIIVLVLTMAFPDLLRPFARIWFGFSKGIGSLMSKISLSIVFFCIVTPIGFFRRYMGKDELKLKAFKKGSASVFIQRNYSVNEDDLKHPY